MNKPSADYVRSRLDYCLVTGIFKFKLKIGNDHSALTFNAQYAGEEAGCTCKDGYITISLDGIGYPAHQLAWLIENGEWPNYPTEMLDHIDRNPSNNRIDNLRLVTPSQSSFNRGISKNNKSGMTGIAWCSKKGKWRVTAPCSVKGKFKKYVSQLSVAISLREEKLVEYYGDFVR